MPVLRPSGSDFTSFVKASAQYVPAGGGGKVSKSAGGGVVIASLGAVAKASVVAIRASPRTSTLIIPSIIAVVAAVTKAVVALLTVTTLAGNDDSTLVDGTGAFAIFSAPYGVAVIPSSGVIVVADYLNNCIRLVTYPGGVVTTLAGSGTAGSNDGTGAAASFSGPIGVAVLSNGNLVVADKNNNRIRLVTYPGGVVTTLAGSGTAAFADGTGAAASFNGPWGVAVLSDGNIAVADSLNHRIRLVDPTSGVVSTLAGSGTGTFADGTGAAASFYGPWGIDVVPSSNVIVVADRSNHRIRLVTYPGGVVTTLAGNSSATFANGTGAAASFYFPNGVAVIPSSNVIIVADANNNRIRQITYPGGAVTTLAGSGSSFPFANGTGTTSTFNSPGSVGVLSDGNVVVADNGNNCIRFVAYPGGGVVTTIAGGNSHFLDETGVLAKFYHPKALAVLSNGNLVVADSDNSRIRLVTYPGGVVTTLAGGGSGNFSNGTGAAASFFGPAGVAVLSDGNIVVADTNNNRIRLVTPDGVVTTLAGNATGTFANGTGTAASFYGPFGVAVIPSSGVIVVADQYNNRIRLVTYPGGVVTTIAGNARAFADGTGAAASFNYPTGVAVLSNGNLVVADKNNNRIRLVTYPGGVVTTIAGNARAFADGTGAAASFYFPQGVAVLSDGNIVVADTNNNRIRLAM